MKRKLSIKVLGITLLSLLLIACGDKTGNTNNDPQVKSAFSENKDVIQPCDVLTDSYIQSTFTGATEVKKFDFSGGCGYTFTQDTLEYNLQLNLESSRNSVEQPEAIFKRLVDFYKENDSFDSLNEVGDKAYYFNKVKNLIALGQGNVIRVQFYFNSNDDDKLKSMTVTVAKDMLAELSKPR